MIRRMLSAGLFLALLLGISAAAFASAGEDDARMQWILPGKALLRSSYGIDALYLSGSGYRELETHPLKVSFIVEGLRVDKPCLLYTCPSPRDLSTSRMPSSA